jgi:2-polyprenyl-6-methoxyphenol hydroxylase-like FAD-dependent oxidoreductase
MGTFSDKPVLIIGGGPVGLALGLELGLRGIPAILIEQRDGTVALPKMNTVSTRTMEFCRRWGVAADVKKAGIGDDHPLDVRFITSMMGYELLRFRYPSYRERENLDYTPEGNCVCSQLWFDPILLARLRSFSSINIRLKTRLESFGEKHDGLWADVTDLDSGKTERISGCYLVGCDGADSLVREGAGIKLLGNPRLNSNLNVFFRCAQFAALQNGRPAQMHRIVGPEGVWANMHALDGRELWRLTVHLRENARQPDVAEIIRRVAGCDIDFEVIEVFRWDRRKMVAERYRSGRVFLAGDSAHQMSTTGGFGMNTGMSDAVDLAWKLEAAVKSWGGPSLLDSYEAERKPIAIRNLEEATENFIQSKAVVPGDEEFMKESSEGERLRRAFTNALLENDVKRQFEVEGIALGYSYDSSPIVWPDGSPAPPEDPSMYKQTSRPGARAPHAWLSEGRSLLDVFGDGFVLLQFGDDSVAAQEFSHTATARKVPLQVVKLDDRGIADVYEKQLVLVRPDGHVSWRSDTAPKDAGAVIDRARGCDVDIQRS